MTEELFIRFAALLAAALAAPSIVFLSFSVTHPAMPYWRRLAYGGACLFVSAMITALRDVVPSIYAIAIANILVGIGYYYLSRAVDAFTLHEDRTNVDFTILIIYFVTIMTIFLLRPPYEIRVSCVSIGILLFSTQIILKIYSARLSISSVGAFVVGASLVLNMALAGIRTISAFTGEFASWLSLSIWDPVFFVGSVAVAGGVSIGFFIIGSSVITVKNDLALAKERELTRKLNSALESQKLLQTLFLHEVKRPLNALSAELQFVKARRTSERSEPDPARLLRLVNESLAYMDQIGELEEVEDLIEEPSTMTISLSSLANDFRHKWNLNVTLQKELLYSEIEVDPFLVDIAVGNLIDNALKFGNDKEIFVLIHNDEKHYLFDIEDGGSGIPRREWVSVWKKFYRLDGPSRNPVRGCGLGLYLVKRIAEVHGGYASVLSETPSRLRFAISRHGSGA